MPAAVDPHADPYLSLGVNRTATDAEIRAAYRVLVARYHPDRHQGNPLEELAAARMIEINRAYEILSRPELRAAYDATVRPPGQATGGAMGGEGTRANAGRTDAVRRMMGRLVVIATVIAALPFFYRFGAGVVRAIGGLLRAAFEATEPLRGTPVALILVLVVVALLGWVGLRRRRRRRRLKTTRAKDRA
jgi:curved DNA-binding protein CbpA